jgi:hypothetical protein
MEKLSDALDAATVQAMADEMRALTPCELHLQPSSMLQMVAILQLAMRHPDFGEHGEAAALARRFIEGACAYFAHCPTVLRLIARGEDPDCDRVN